MKPKKNNVPVRGASVWTYLLSPLSRFKMPISPKKSPVTIVATTAPDSLLEAEQLVSSYIARYT